MHGRLLLLPVFLLLSLHLAAQTYSVIGRVADFKDTSALAGVIAFLKDGNDTSKNTGLGGFTDNNGSFRIEGVSPGRYLLHLEYLGYRTQNRMINVGEKDFNAGVLAMRASTKELSGVTVSGRQIRAEQRGDTTSFHADAFKVNPDATAEDLITKMPGVASDNSGVKVNGEAVQQVYVDGKPFFGTDPTLSVRNLPAEVVDKVEIYDQLSDQALFTGFDDGNQQKTMNFVTRVDKRQGEFGKIYAGYGTDGTYLAGESFNSFHGSQRISIIELSNNVNQQNFSSQDLLGISGGGGGGGRGGGMGGMFGGGGGGGGGASSFLTGQQAGITTTHSFGINYSDKWGTKITVTASYFFNYTNNSNNTQTLRNYTIPASVLADSIQTNLYDEKDYSNAKNYNHRFTMRLEYTMDSFNSIIEVPTFSLQNNYSQTSQFDTSFNMFNQMIGYSGNSSNLNNMGYTLSNNLTLRHKLAKKGRTISLSISNSLNEKSGDGVYNTITSTVDSEIVLQAPVQVNQHYNLYNNSNSISGNLAYTEPLGKKSQLLFNYNPSVTQSKSNKETDTLNSGTDVLNFDTVLSNYYKSIYTTQRGGASYRYSTKTLNFMIGANYQYAVLDGSEIYPEGTKVTRTYSNVLPIAFFNYKFKNGKNLRIFYRSNISAPGITQLQNVIDVSNPLLMSTGDTALRQDFEQTLVVRYGLTRSKTAHNFFLNGYANYISNYIGNATYTNTNIRADSVLAGGILLKPGAQLTAPVNLNYYSSDRLFVTYGLPLDVVKSNLNLTGGFNYTHTPGRVNQVTDYSNNYVPTAGIVVSSNVSEKLDFTLAYTGNYNFVKNSLQTKTNNNYYNHIASFKINWIFLKGFVLNTNITHSYYSTFSSNAGTIDFYLWNAYVGYKFFKNRSLEARLSAFDLLNENKSVTRTVAANYVENDITTVLKQYFMFQLTYTLRNFKGTLPTPENGPNLPPGMMPPGGGGGQHWHDHD